MPTFSIPLDPDQDFSRVIHVVDKKAAKWMVPELSDNLKIVWRLRHLEPKRDLIVTIGKEVKALNNATFSKDYEKTITTVTSNPVSVLPAVVRCCLVKSLKGCR